MHSLEDPREPWLRRPGVTLSQLYRQMPGLADTRERLYQAGQLVVMTFITLKAGLFLVAFAEGPNPGVTELMALLLLLGTMGAALVYFFPQLTVFPAARLHRWFTGSLAGIAGCSLGILLASMAARTPLPVMYCALLGLMTGFFAGYRLLTVPLLKWYYDWRRRATKRGTTHA